MKIINVNKFLYHRAGAETYFFELSDLLAEHGHEVIPFAMRHPKNIFSPYQDYFPSFIDFTHPSVKDLFRIPGRMIYSLEVKRCFERLVQDVKPDIVHLHNIYHQLSPSLLDVCAKYRIPVVHTLHDYKLVCPNYKLFANGTVDEECRGGNYLHDVFTKSLKNSYLRSALAALEKSIHDATGITTKNTAVWISSSHFTKEVFVRFGFEEEKIRVIPYSMRFEETIERKEKQNEPFLLAYGRLAPEKGFDVLIRALRHIDMSLKIVGDGEEEKKLRALAEQYGVANKISFMPRMSHKEIKELIVQSTLVIVPSLWYEVLPFAVLEPLGLGVPVIGSHLGGTAEILSQVDESLTFRPGDVRDLADKVNTLLAHHSQRKLLGIKGKAFVRELCNREKHYARIIALYESLL